MSRNLLNFISIKKIGSIIKNGFPNNNVTLGVSDIEGKIILPQKNTNSLEKTKYFIQNFSKKNNIDYEKVYEPEKNFYIKILPLTHNKESIGFFFLCSDQKKELTTNNNAIINIIHTYIKDMIYYRYDIDNMSYELVKNYEDMSIMYHLSSKLSVSLVIEDMCKIIAAHIRKILPVKNISILLLDIKKNSLYSKYSSNNDGEKNPFFQLMKNEGITWSAITNKTSIIECNVHTNDLFKEVSYPIGSLLTAPMIANRRVIGALNLSDKINNKEFSSNDLKLTSSIASVAASAIDGSFLYNDIRELFWSLVRALVSALDAKDKYTYGHSKRVADISVNIAKETDFSKNEFDHLYLAALLHDIGKIGISESILLKTEKLSAKEWCEIQKHPYHASNILQSVKQFDRIEQWVKHEHERFDGKGYPDKLKGRDIPLPSRIIAIADAYDAMTSDRAYRKSLPEEEALSLLEKHSGVQFDPILHKAFLKAYKKGNISKK